jgi:hypothetical protein
MNTPEGLHIEKDALSLRIGYSQFKPIVWMALIAGALFIWLGIYLFATGGILVVPLTSLFLGLLLVYCALVGLYNKRTIQVDHDQVQVSYGPLPFEKSQALASNQLSQLYTHKMMTPSRYGDIGGFTLAAILTDGRHLPLVSDPSYERLHYLENQIEDWLGIKDLQVEGEVQARLHTIR